MKRTLALLIIIAACVAGFLSIRGAMPFLSVFGSSMEPELHAGNLILIGKLSPSHVKVGDIIVFAIPAAVREQYNYPPVIAHRVIKVDTVGGITFRTKGDNTGEDPFTVRPQDLLGQVSKQIPYLGFPFLFFQSQQGLIFIIIALSLFALYLYGSEISRGKQKVQRGIFAPIIQQNEALARRQEQTSQMSSKALEQFATAMSEYAQHLVSHTSAIKGLSEASQELRKGAAEQNRVLSHMVEIMEQRAPKAEKVKPELEEIKFPPGCVRSPLKKRRLKVNS